MYCLRLTIARVSVACLSSESAQGQSYGRWQMPSTCFQFWGYAYGPGHHVPIIRAPTHKPLYVQRITLASSCEPAFCQSGCSMISNAGPTCYASTGNCGNSGCYAAPMVPQIHPQTEMFGPPALEAVPAPVENEVLEQTPAREKVTPPVSSNPQSDNRLHVLPDA